MKGSWPIRATKMGLHCFEPRTDRTNHVTKHEKLADWNMEDVWGRLGEAEIDNREHLRQHYKMHPGQPWGRLTNIPPETLLYELDEF